MNGYNDWATVGSTVANGSPIPAVPMGALYPGGILAPAYTGFGQGAPTIQLPSDAQTTAAQQVASQPWSLKNSPLPWVIIIGIVGFLGLHFVLYGKSE